MRDDWEQYLIGKGQVWVITPLYYEKGGSKIVRKASEYLRWHNHTSKHIKYGDTSWHERKFKLVGRTNKKQDTKEGAGGQKYMFEYSPDEIKPTHALCRLVVDKKNKEIVHTDSNNGDRGETSLSYESMQQGGNFENATRYYNDQSNLEMFFARIIQGGELSKFMKHFSKDDIVKVFSLKMDQIPAASPKEHCTTAAVTNPTKRHRCTNKKTIREEDVSTQIQEQDKVRAMLFEESPFSLYDPQHGQMGESTSYPGDPTLGMSFEDLYNPEMFQPNAALQDPNFILNYTEGRLGHQTVESTSYPGDLTNLHRGNCIPSQWGPTTSWTTYHYQEELYNLWDVPEDPNFIVNYTEDRLDHQMVELHAALQDNQNRIAPDPNTSNFATTGGLVGSPGPSTSTREH